MTDNVYWPAIDDVEAAAKGLQAAVAEIIDALTEATEAYPTDDGRLRDRLEDQRGRLEAALVDGAQGVVRHRGGETRLTPTAAYRQLEHAVMEYRAAAIRILVDESGMSYSGVAALVGVSRQMVARLYRQASRPDR